MTLTIGNDRHSFHFLEDPMVIDGSEEEGERMDCFMESLTYLRTSPSVRTVNPRSFCNFTIWGTTLSSSALTSSAEHCPVWKAKRFSTSSLGRRREPTWSARGKNFATVGAAIAMSVVNLSGCVPRGGTSYGFIKYCRCCQGCARAGVPERSEPQGEGRNRYRSTMLLTTLKSGRITE